MSRRGPRVRIAKGIYQDGSGLAATVKVGSLPQRERRYPFGTSFKTIQAWQDETRVELRKDLDLPAAGTLEADIPRYLAKLTIVTKADRARELRAWTDRFGTRLRRSLKTRELDDQLRDWRITDGLAVQTVLNRKFALSNLFKILDGKSARNPVADCLTLERPDSTSRGLPLSVIDEVLGALTDDCLTQIRLRLMRWTAMRPSQMTRLRAHDFDLDGPMPSVLVPRGKRGRLVRVPLMPEAIPVAQLFIKCTAWRPWSRASANKALIRAICSVNKRRAQHLLAPIPIFSLYKIKHSVASTLRTVMDLADVQETLGHADARTTAIYAPPVSEKLYRGFQVLRCQPMVTKTKWAT